jgi:hypothetical protein
MNTIVWGSALALAFEFGDVTPEITLQGKSDGKSEVELGALWWAASVDQKRSLALGFDVGGALDAGVGQLFEGATAEFSVGLSGAHVWRSEVDYVDNTREALRACVAVCDWQGTCAGINQLRREIVGNVLINEAGGLAAIERQYAVDTCDARDTEPKWTLFKAALMTDEADLVGAAFLSAMEVLRVTGCDTTTAVTALRTSTDQAVVDGNHGSNYVCPAQTAKLTSTSTRFDPTRLAFGADVGVSPMTWREGSGAAPSVEQKKSLASVEAGLTFTRLFAPEQKSTWGLVAHGAYARTAEASEDKGEWCTSDAGTADGAAISVCEDGTVGRPTIGDKGTLDLYAAWVDSADGRLAFLLGPSLVYGAERAWRGDLDTSTPVVTQTFSATLRAPVTLSLGAFDRSNKEDLGFDGLLRLTPYAGVGFDDLSDPKAMAVYGIEVGLLTRKSLVSNRWDEL